MKYKILFILIIILTLFLANSCVSAHENTTKKNILNNDFNKTIQESKLSNINSFSNQKMNINNITSNKTTLENKQNIPSILLINQTANNKDYINYKLKNNNLNIVTIYIGNNICSESNDLIQNIDNSKIKTSIYVQDRNINYRTGSKNIFQIKLVDINNRSINGKIIKIKINNSIYQAKTDSHGLATFYLNLKKGKHFVNYVFDGDTSYDGTV